MLAAATEKIPSRVRENLVSILLSLPMVKLQYITSKQTATLIITRSALIAAPNSSDLVRAENLYALIPASESPFATSSQTFSQASASGVSQPPLEFRTLLFLT